MKIIAIATENGMVCPHFGHAPEFSFVEIEGDSIKNITVETSPGHGHGTLPPYISEKGASVVISGGMGKGATDAFDELNIETITGASGSIESVASEYISGNLVSTGETCTAHEHSHECGNH